MSSQPIHFSLFLRDPKVQAYVADSIEESLLPIDLFDRLDCCAQVSCDPCVSFYDR